MAWVGQCRMAFKINADAILWKQKGKKKITPVLRQLSEESGIPLGTLKRWWYEQEEEKEFKNEPNGESQGNTSDSGKNLPSVPCFSHPTCVICGKKKVERYRDKKGKWYYREKCRKCRQIGEPSYQDAAEIQVLCPLCGGQFKLKKEDLHYE